MYKHLIKLDDFNNIIHIESIEDSKPTPAGMIEFETSEEETFSPEPGVQVWGEWDPFEITTIPHYYYNQSKHQILKRPQEDIEEDIRNAPPPPPTSLERIESQVFYTAMMTDTLIEE